MPVTAGTFRNLDVVAPENTVFNAREPHATLDYYPPLGLAIDLTIKALGGPARSRGRRQPADPMSIPDPRDRSRLGMRPTKQWGQNFVVDANTVRRIVRSPGWGRTTSWSRSAPGSAR